MFSLYLLHSLSFFYLHLSLLSNWIYRVGQQSCGCTAQVQGSGSPAAALYKSILFALFALDNVLDGCCFRSSVINFRMEVAGVTAERSNQYCKFMRILVVVVSTNVINIICALALNALHITTKRPVHQNNISALLWSRMRPEPLVYKSPPASRR